MNRFALVSCAFALTAGALSCAASAAEWEPVTDTETAIYLLDRGSLSSTQGRMRAWVLVTGPYGRGLPDYGSRTQLMVFDCGQRALALKEYVLHALPGGQGAVLRTEAYEDDGLEFTQPGPGSVGAQLLGAVCDPQ
ncbi:MAG: surface-adhesin E family protein [Burkholderiales bacterium]